MHIQFTQTLEISQQTMNTHDMSHRRVPVSALSVLAHALAASIGDLIGSTPTAATTKRGPATKPEQQMDHIAKAAEANAEVRDRHARCCAGAERQN